MLAMRSPLLRLPATLILLVLLGVSVFCIKNIIAKAWRKDRQEEARYLRAPNCFPMSDQSPVDASLPPCENVTWRVTAKPQNTTIDHYRFHDYPKTHCLLTLDDGRGETQTVGDIHQDMWGSIKIGDQVSVKLWQNRVREVTANGYSSTIFDDRDWHQASTALWPWVILGLVCSGCLSLLWRLGRGRANRDAFPV